MTWEYRIVVFDGIASRDEREQVERDLTSLGSDGWEAYAVTKSGDFGRRTFYLKRPQGKAKSRVKVPASGAHDFGVPSTRPETLATGSDPDTF